MKKSNIIFAACIATLAGVAITTPTFAGDSRNVSIKDEVLYDAILNHATVTPSNHILKQQEGTLNVTVLPGITSIEFDCGGRNILKDVKDFSFFDNLTDLEEITICSDSIDYDFPDSVNIIAHAVDSFGTNDYATAMALSRANYKGASYAGMESHSQNYSLKYRHWINEITDIAFDCTDGDPLADITNFSFLSKFEGLKSIGVCSEDFGQEVPEGVKVYLNTPEGRAKFTLEEAGLKEGTIAKLEYIENEDRIINTEDNGDITELLRQALELQGESDTISVVYDRVENHPDNKVDGKFILAENAKADKNGVLGSIIVKVGDKVFYTANVVAAEKKAAADDTAEETAEDGAENPDTADDLTNIIVTVATASIALGAGAFIFGRRR